jgi:peptide chain release factor 2
MASLNAKSEDPTLWNDPKAAQKIMRQRQSLERAIVDFKKLQSDFDDAKTLIELGEAEDDDGPKAKRS